MILKLIIIIFLLKNKSQNNKGETMILEKNYSYFKKWEGYEVKINGEIIHNVMLNGSLNFKIFPNTQESLTLKIKNNGEEIASINFLTQVFQDFHLLPHFIKNNLTLEENKLFWEDKLNLKENKIKVSYLDEDELEFKIPFANFVENKFIDLDFIIDEMIAILKI